MEEQTASGAQVTPLGAPAAPRKLTILVIEDDTLTRITLCKIFDKMNYTAIEACNGYMGLKMYNRHKPDIIVTDLLMPDKEGIQTISEIRAVDKKVKIVAMSGGGSTHNMTFLGMAKKMGADLTLSKPFTPNQILELLQSLKTTETGA